MRFAIAWLAAWALVASARSETRRDIEYGTAGGEALLLDAHVPDGAGPFPIAILIHGGGWSGGDKSGSNRPGDGADISPWFETLSAANYTWFSINYRLAPKNRWPASFEDVQAAVRWVKAHAGEYKGDARRIAVFGHSAGGHLALLLAEDPSPETRVQAVVGFAPVSDLVSDTERRGGLSTSLQNLFGFPKEMTADSRKVLWEASPLSRVRSGMPPVLIVHGDADKTVPLDQSRAFIARLKEAGVPCELIVRPGAPHSLVGGEKIETAYRERMLAWLAATLK